MNNKKLTEEQIARIDKLIELIESVDEEWQKLTYEFEALSIKDLIGLNAKIKEAAAVLNYAHWCVSKALQSRLQYLQEEAARAQYDRENNDGLGYSDTTLTVN